MEEGGRKEEMEEGIFNVSSYAVQHVIFFYKSFLSLTPTVSLCPLSVSEFLKKVIYSCCFPNIYFYLKVTKTSQLPTQWPFLSPNSPWSFGKICHGFFLFLLNSLFLHVLGCLTFLAPLTTHFFSPYIPFFYFLKVEFLKDSWPSSLLSSSHLFHHRFCLCKFMAPLLYTTPLSKYLAQASLQGSSFAFLNDCQCLLSTHPRSPTKIFLKLSS